MPLQRETHVLIVGAGPVGLVTGLLLEQLGLDYLIVERRSTLHNAPQAHVLSSRTLEICRSLGIEHTAIRQAGPKLEDTLAVRWVDNLTGHDLGVFSLASDRDAVERMLTQTPTPTCNLSQDRFERLLFDRLSDPSRLLFDHAWESLEATDSGYLSRVTAGDPEAVTEIRSRFVIGADGAGSRVRNAIGGHMIGPDNIQTFVNIHFRANLRDHLKGREGLLFWVMDGDITGTFIAHDIDSNWIFMKTVDDESSLDPIDEAQYASLLRRAVGTDVDLEIMSMNTWRMTAQISDAYQRGGVFLAGDAAHRFPPTGGIGMNTGFQDAHNLAWKIGMVSAGFDAGLLATYEPERKPVAEANSAQSHQNARKMSEVSGLLDVDGNGRITGDDLDAVLEDPLRLADVQSAINRQAAHFNMSGLDLGFCYDSDAVFGDGTPPQSADPVSTYLPSTTPGARLPHVWLIRDAEQISTLDLVRCDRLLVLTHAAADPELEATVASLTDAGYPLELLRIGANQHCQPADAAFEQLFGHSGVLLIRPDAHIAARLIEKPAARLGAVVTRLLGSRPG